MNDADCERGWRTGQEALSSEEESDEPTYFEYSATLRIFHVPAHRCGARSLEELLPTPRIFSESQLSQKFLCHLFASPSVTYELFNVQPSCIPFPAVLSLSRKRHPVPTNKLMKPRKTHSNQNWLRFANSSIISRNLRSFFASKLVSFRKTGPPPGGK